MELWRKWKEKWKISRLKQRKVWSDEGSERKSERWSRLIKRTVWCDEEVKGKVKDKVD